MLGDTVTSLERLTRNMVAHVKPSETPLAQIAGNIVHAVAELVDDIARSIKRLQCIMQATKTPESRIVPVCTSWRLYVSDNSLVLVRLKPETVIRFSDSNLFFQSSHVSLEVTGTTIKLCRHGYCRDFNTLSHSLQDLNLQQVQYILRFVSNLVKKATSSITLCARKVAPDCARI